jgi:ComF family protein
MAMCGRCLVHPPPYDRAVTAFDYQFPWDRLIAAFKFGGDLSLLPALAGEMVHALTAANASDAVQVDYVVPMPLSEQRLRERGFNQAWSLASTVSTALALNARHDLLLRWRDTAHQVSLKREERLANLKQAFMPAPGARLHLAGRTVALVDDVMTTGASAAQAALALKEGGAARVHLWLLARTPDAAPG